MTTPERRLVPVTAWEARKVCAGFSWAVAHPTADGFAIDVTDQVQAAQVLDYLRVLRRMKPVSETTRTVPLFLNDDFDRPVGKVEIQAEVLDAMTTDTTIGFGYRVLTSLGSKPTRIEVLSFSINSGPPAERQV